MSDAIPAISGLRYLQPLGSGGFADVYLYEQQMPLRKVAVKVLRRSDLDESLRRQFIAEANAMAALADHPNIVPVFSTGETDDGRPYLLMSYYSRPNLSVRAAAERLSVSEVLRVGIQVASAVETAHRASILHRDIKPANILTSQYGAPGLSDFGISAQLAAAEEDDDDMGVSVPWASPEVLFSTGPATVRSDVYSVGATLWHLLVGRSPFEAPGGDNRSHALMSRIRDAAPPTTGRGDVPTSLERLLQQAMAKDPTTRPASALALARSLLAVEQELRYDKTDIVVLADEHTRVARTALPAAEAPRTAARAPQRVSPAPAAPKFQDPPPTANRKPTAAEPSPAAGTEASPVPRQVLPVASRPARALPETIHRPTAAPDPNLAPPAIPRRPRGTRRYLVFIAVGVVVIISVVVGVVLSSGDTLKGAAGSPSPSASSGGNGTPDDAANAGETLPPGPVKIKAARVGHNVTFSWTYDVPLAGDTFLWRSPGSAKQARAPKSSLTLPDPTGNRLCIQVKVVRDDGSNAGLDWSEEGCG
jgi:eukaryotic-like serine/threonine-protein kinase